jgi:hypothetical protein
VHVLQHDAEAGEDALGVGLRLRQPHEGVQEGAVSVALLVVALVLVLVVVVGGVMVVVGVVGVMVVVGVMSAIAC